MHGAGVDPKGDAIEDTGAAQAQADTAEVDGGADAFCLDALGYGHAPASWMARTTVSRLLPISFSYLSALYWP
ncbi:hypothetical protein D3C75_1286790 [compost metagenome]